MGVTISSGYTLQFRTKADYSSSVVVRGSTNKIVSADKTKSLQLIEHQIIVTRRESTRVLYSHFPV